MPARMMRLATYQPASDEGPVEIAVFYFGPGQGGDVESNISRWVGQFQDVAPDGVQRSEDEHNGFRRFHVRIERGTFASSMPGGPKGAQRDWGMSATIVETKEGPYFFKMTGASAAVQKQQARFEQLLSSITAKP